MLIFLNVAATSISNPPTNNSPNKATYLRKYQIFIETSNIILVIASQQFLY